LKSKQNDKDKKKEEEKNGGSSAKEEEESSSQLSRTVNLFRRVPTLAASFCEVITFQSLSTVLAICFVRQLKASMPLDTDRAAFTGLFYAYINGSSGLMQFFVLPLARKYLEPRWAYRLMPMLLLPWLVYLAFQSNSLWMQTVAFFSLKTLDYSLRNVVNEMVYQPLDFDSRYVGKEVIGVFANRFGKSGMSMILSIITAQFPTIGVAQLSQFSVVVASIWTSCSVWLSRNVVSNTEAERRVQERQQSKKKE
jgi:ATP/ADP translocase